MWEKMETFENLDIVYMGFQQGCLPIYFESYERELLQIFVWVLNFASHSLSHDHFSFVLVFY